LKKILVAKLIYQDNRNKMKFINTNLIGIKKMVDIVIDYGIVDKKIIKSIVECIRFFFYAVGID
jgi:hypothetical protein